MAIHRLVERFRHQTAAAEAVDRSELSKRSDLSDHPGLADGPELASPGNLQADGAAPALAPLAVAAGGHGPPPAAKPELCSHPLGWGSKSRDRWQVASRLMRGASHIASPDGHSVRRRPLPPAVSLTQLPSMHRRSPEVRAVSAHLQASPRHASVAATAACPAGWWSTALSTCWVSDHLSSGRLPAFWPPAWWQSLTDSGFDVERASGVSDGSDALYAPAVADPCGAPLALAEAVAPLAPAAAGALVAPGARPVGLASPADRVANSPAVAVVSSPAAPTIAALSAVLAASLARSPAADLSAGGDGSTQDLDRSASSSPATVSSLGFERSDSEVDIALCSDVDSCGTGWWETTTSDAASQCDRQADPDAWVDLG